MQSTSGARVYFKVTVSEHNSGNKPFRRPWTKASCACFELVCSSLPAILTFGHASITLLDQAMAFHWLRDIPAEIRLEVYKAYFSTITISPHSGFTKCCWRNQCENLVLSLLLASKTVYIEAQPLAWNFVTIKLTACTSSSRWLLTDKTWKRATKVLQSGLKLRVSSSRTLFEFEFGLPSITQLSKFNIQQLDLPYMQVCLNDDCVERVYRLLEKGIQKVVVGFLTIEVRGKALVRQTIQPHALCWRLTKHGDRLDQVFCRSGDNMVFI